MVKANCLSLGLNQQNFNNKLRSRRISSIRLKYQWRFNKLKRNFKKKRYNLIKNLTNKDSDDIITLEPIKNISKFDLFVLKANNLSFGVSASNLVKWMSTFNGDEIPKNPFTNLPLTKEERNECYKVAYDYFLRNSKIDSKSDENLRLLAKLTSFKSTDFFRRYPDVTILFYTTMVDQLERILCDIFDMQPGTSFCITCLKIFDQIVQEDVPEYLIERIKNIGYRLEQLYNKIDEIKLKIEQKYFV